MGAIKLATSSTTDEEYGGTFPLDASDIPYDANTTVKQKIDEVDGKFDYSTAEKKIGTWVDGSTIYEKTILFSSTIIGDANTWIDTGITVASLNINANICFDAKLIAVNRVGYPGICTVSETTLKIMHHRVGASVGFAGVVICYNKLS